MSGLDDRKKAQRTAAPLNFMLNPATECGPSHTTVEELKSRAGKALQEGAVEGINGAAMGTIVGATPAGAVIGAVGGAADGFINGGGDPRGTVRVYPNIENGAPGLASSGKNPLRHVSGMAYTSPITLPLNDNQPLVDGNYALPSNVKEAALKAGEHFLGFLKDQGINPKELGLDLRGDGNVTAAQAAAGLLASSSWDDGTRIACGPGAAPVEHLDTKFHSDGKLSMSAPLAPPQQLKARAFLAANFPEDGPTPADTVQPGKPFVQKLKTGLRGAPSPL